MTDHDDGFSIQSVTKGNLPERLPFREIKDHVLGETYSLSLVFIDDATSEKLNSEYRSKNKPTNVLSFPLTPEEGEIFITLPVAEREAKAGGYELDEYIGYLFIHGLHHLKGLNHGSTMEKQEAAVRKKFAIAIM